MRKSESGQAIVELTMSLVAIMTVFLGVIFAFAIGRDNVENIIACRGQCDEYAGNGYPHGDDGSHILDWDDGGDGRILTNDDTPIVGGDDYPALFEGELRTDEVDLLHGFEEDHVVYNFASELEEYSSIFLAMADLTKDTETTDPYDEGIIEDLRGAFRALVYDADVEITNTVYMPIFYSEEE